MQPAWKNKNSNQQNHHKKKQHIFLFKKTPPLQHIVSHLMFIIWNFIAYFKIEYSLIGILNPKSIRIN